MLGALKNLFSGKSDTPANTYWQGTIGLTLMVYKNELETHVQSGIRRYDYFFSSWRTTYANPRRRRTSKNVI